MNPKAIRQTGETRVALNCEFYDDGQGIDAHCSYYWDQANPLPDPYVMTRPTPPSKEWPTHPDL